MVLKKVTSLTSSIGNISVGTSDIGSTASANYFGSAISSAGKSLQQRVKQNTQPSFESDSEYKRFKSIDTILSAIDTDDGRRQRTENRNKFLEYAEGYGPEMYARVKSDNESYLKVFEAKEYSSAQDKAIANIISLGKSKILDDVDILNSDPDLFYESLKQEGFDFGGMFSNESLQKAFGYNDQQFEDFLNSKKAIKLNTDLNNMRIASLEEYSTKIENEQTLLRKANFEFNVNEGIKTQTLGDSKIENINNILQYRKDVMQGSYPEVWSPEDGAFNTTTFDNKISQYVATELIVGALDTENPEQALNILQNMFTTRQGGIVINGKEVTYDNLVGGFDKAIVDSLEVAVKKLVATSLDDQRYLRIKKGLETDKAVSTEDVNFFVSKTIEEVNEYILTLDNTNLSIAIEAALYINTIIPSGNGTANTRNKIYKEQAGKLLELMRRGPEDAKIVLDALNDAEIKNKISYDRQMSDENSELKALREAYRDSNLQDKETFNEFYQRYNSSEESTSYFAQNTGVVLRGDQLTAKIFSVVTDKITDSLESLIETGTFFERKKLDGNIDEALLFGEGMMPMPVSFDANEKPNFSSKAVMKSAKEKIFTNPTFINYLNKEIKLRIRLGGADSGKSLEKIAEGVLNDAVEQFGYTDFHTSGFITRKEISAMQEILLNKDDELNLLKKLVDPDQIKGFTHASGTPLRVEDLEFGKHLRFVTHSEVIIPVIGEDGEPIEGSGQQKLLFKVVAVGDTGAFSPLKDRNGDTIFIHNPLGKRVDNQDVTLDLNTFDKKRLKEKARIRNTVKLGATGYPVIPGI